MNLLFIDREFKKLNLVEDFINYKFEPRSKVYKGFKRHIYYEDLKYDFVDEVNAYGFSPFIQETYDNQRKDKNIMQYKTNYLNQGLLNYVKKRNKDFKQNLNIIDYKLVLDDDDKKKKSKSERIYGKNRGRASIVSPEKIDNNSKNIQDNFLKKALENLNRNKLNLSNDSNIFDKEKEKQKESMKASGSSKKVLANKKEYDLNKLKSDYLNSLNFKVTLNPLISDSTTKSPQLNFERFFNNAKVSNRNPDSRKEQRKVVGLFKNKDIMKNIKMSKTQVRFPSHNSQEVKIFKEINREKVDLKESIKIANIKRKSENVFNKLYSLRPNQFGKVIKRKPTTPAIVTSTIKTPQKPDLYIINTNTKDSNEKTMNSKRRNQSKDGDFTYSHNDTFTLALIEKVKVSARQKSKI